MPSSSENKGYPIDIAVFNNENKTYDSAFMVVECKRKTRNEGLDQLKIYMRLSSAHMGVWFNGKEHAYIQKILDKNGNTIWRELPNIPKYRQRIEDIGMYKRKDLQPPSDLKVVFRDIRNHLAGMSETLPLVFTQVRGIQLHLNRLLLSPNHLRRSYYQLLLKRPNAQAHWIR